MKNHSSLPRKLKSLGNKIQFIKNQQPGKEIIIDAMSSSNPSSLPIYLKYLFPLFQWQARN